MRCGPDHGVIDDTIGRKLRPVGTHSLSWRDARSEAAVRVEVTTNGVEVTKSGGEAELVDSGAVFTSRLMWSPPRTSGAAKRSLSLVAKAVIEP
jgi:hypothetical protein